MGGRRRRSNKSTEEVSAGNSGAESKSESESEEAKEGSSSKKAKNGDDASSQYEQIRNQRIKENMERMQNLGLLKLSEKIKLQPPKKNPRPKKNPESTNRSPQRRSSRIMTLPPVKYYDTNIMEYEGSNEIVIPEGKNREFYTEEQEKLLGDCENPWELNVDGYDSDGNRIYDQNKGETCHQCRQKILCQHTSCNKCELPQGQFCGDCLYTRYGENLFEASVNPKWTCPPCRDICNCRRCRKSKGWMPTGNIYNKVTKLGYKSVGHYLILTRGAEKIPEGSGAEDTGAEETPQASAKTMQNRRIGTRRTSRY